MKVSETSQIEKRQSYKWWGLGTPFVNLVAGGLDVFKLIPMFDETKYDDIVHIFYNKATGGDSGQKSAAKMCRLLVYWSRPENERL